MHAQFWLDSTQVPGWTPDDAGQKSAWETYGSLTPGSPLYL
jgi:hypothetical protein